MTISCTWSLSAPPWPATASFTSFGLYCATGMPSRAAATSASPLAWPTEIAVRAFDWNSTRSTASARGRELGDQVIELAGERCEPFRERHRRIGADHAVADGATSAARVR